MLFHTCFGLLPTQKSDHVRDHASQKEVSISAFDANGGSQVKRYIGPQAATRDRHSMHWAPSLGGPERILRPIGGKDTGRELWDEPVSVAARNITAFLQVKKVLHIIKIIRGEASFIYNQAPKGRGGWPHAKGKLAQAPRRGTQP